MSTETVYKRNKAIIEYFRDKNSCLQKVQRFILKSNSLKHYMSFISICSIDAQNL